MQSKKGITKTIVIIVLSILLVTTIAGITFSFFIEKKSSEKQEVLAGDLSFTYSKKEINASNLTIIEKDEIEEKAASIGFNLNNSGSHEVMSEISMIVNNIDEGLKQEYVKYKLVENDFEIASGNFSDIESGNKVLLKDEIYFASKWAKDYKLYVYIEATDQNQNSIVGQNISVSIDINARQVRSTTMKNMSSQSGKEDAFWISDYRTRITHIDFVDYVKLDNAVELTNGTKINYWDLSLNSDGTVKGWLEIDTENSTEGDTYYKLYIGTNKDYIFLTSVGGYYIFDNFTNLKEIKFGKIFRIDKTQSFTKFFANCKKLERIDLDYFDTDSAINMMYMFQNCNLLEEINLEGFNTSNVTSMNGMFQGCNTVSILDVSKFDTSKVEGMSLMFNGCHNVTELDVSNFNTSKVKNMTIMFGSCKLLKELDVSNFDTSQVENMSQMFSGCNNLTSLDVSNFNTSKVKNMSQMFYNCISLTTLDLSNFDTSQVESMNIMFQYCRNLKYVDLSSFNTEKVTTMYAMFYDCNSLTTLDLSSFTITSEVNTGAMLTGTSLVKYAYAKNSETAALLNNITGKPSSHTFTTK